MNLWLDDQREAPKGWIRVRSTKGAKALLQTGRVEKLSLDHDLDRPEFQGVPIPRPGAETGTDLVRWMVHTGHWPASKPQVHSGNAKGAKTMQNLVERHFPGETTLPTLSRVPGHVALAIGERLEKELRPLCTRLSIAGSLRRDRARIRKGEPLSTKDIDLVASPKTGVSVQEVLEKFQSLSLQNRGGHSSARIFLNGLKAELDVVPPEHFEPMLMTATGNKTENLKLRVAAKKLGLSLTEKGLRDSKGQILVTKPKDIYRALGRPYKAPSERSKQRREA